MVTIPGVAYLVIGAVMALFSLFVTNDKGERTLTLFIFVGIFFLLVGVVKLMFGKKKPKHPAKRHPAQATIHQQPLHYTTQHHQGQQHVHQSHPHQRSHVVHPQEVMCPHCHARNHPMANFCSRCGNKLKA